MGERSGSSGLLPRAVHAAWGWRLEAGLFLVAVVVLRLAGRLGPGGDLLLIGLFVVAFWRIPPLRRFFAVRLRDAVLRRRFGRALRACGVLDPYGFPAVGQVATTPAGERLAVRCPSALTSGFGDRRPVPGRRAPGSRDPGPGQPLGRFRRHRRGRSTRPLCRAAADLAVGQRRSGLALAARAPRRDESGHAVLVGLPEHNLLLGGEPGGGKSAVLSLLVAAAALDPSVTLTLFDAKQVELAPWAGSADTFVGPDAKKAVETLKALRAEMDTRYERLLADGRRKIEANDGFGLHVVAIDELAYFLRGGAKADRDGFAEGLRDLVSRGRAAGIVVLAATQKPSHDIVPTAVRDLFSFRMALRCTTPEPPTPSSARAGRPRATRPPPSTRPPAASGSSWPRAASP